MRLGSFSYKTRLADAYVIGFILYYFISDVIMVLIWSCNLWLKKQIFYNKIHSLSHCNKETNMEV